MRHSPLPLVVSPGRVRRRCTEFNHAPYVDRPPHDAPDQAREDDAKTRALIEAGYIVIRFYHGADWRVVFRRHPALFGVASE